MKMNIPKRILLILLILTVFTLTSCRSTGPESANGISDLSSLDILDGMDIGVCTGMITDKLVEKRLPNSRIMYFTNISDAVAAIKTGKIAAYPDDEPILGLCMAENPELTTMEEYLDATDFGAIFPKTEKGAQVRDKFNDWLKAFIADGELDKLKAKWISGPESEKIMPDYKFTPSSKGRFVVATTGQIAPMNYVKDNSIVGIDAEIAARFCMAEGYELEIIPMAFDAVIPYVQSGKGDMGITAISITAERAESVYFSDPYYHSELKMLVLSNASAGKDILTGVIESFEKTFIKENRWILFAEGLKNTMIMTVLSIIFGTVLGFAVFMLCRKGNKALNKVFAFCTWLIQGMPMVVLLMVLFYIVFASFNIAELYVAVIGFTLTFGAAVFSMLKTGIGAIDRGQYEAAYTLGYSDTKAFFRFIFPQALPLILPSYKSEIVGLIKATAIVGYIAVQDLTKMGDVVRSRTYEPFFSLIFLSILYFIIEGLVAYAVSKIAINLDPKRRKRDSVLKGVKTDDQN